MSAGRLWSAGSYPWLSLGGVKSSTWIFDYVWGAGTPEPRVAQESAVWPVASGLPFLSGLGSREQGSASRGAGAAAAVDRELSISQTVSTRRGPCRAQCRAGTAVQLLRAAQQRQLGSLRLPVSPFCHERGVSGAALSGRAPVSVPRPPSSFVQRGLARPPCAGEGKRPRSARPTLTRPPGSLCRPWLAAQEHPLPEGLARISHTFPTKTFF